MEFLSDFIQKVKTTFFNQHDQKSISEHENCWCIDKIDLLLEDQRKDPDESLLKTDYLSKRRQAITNQPLTHEELERLKSFSRLIIFISFIDLEHYKISNRTQLDF